MFSAFRFRWNGPRSPMAEGKKAMIRWSESIRFRRGICVYREKMGLFALRRRIHELGDSLSRFGYAAPQYSKLIPYICKSSRNAQLLLKGA